MPGDAYPGVRNRRKSVGGSLSADGEAAPRERSHDLGPVDAVVVPREAYLAHEVGVGRFEPLEALERTAEPQDAALAANAAHLDRLRLHGHASILVVAAVSAFPSRLRKPIRVRVQFDRRGRIPTPGMWPTEDVGMRRFAAGEADNCTRGRDRLTEGFLGEVGPAVGVRRGDSDPFLERPAALAGVEKR